MDRGFAANRWVYGAAYLGVANLVLLLHVMPIEVGPNGYPGPDFLIAITFVWVLRRPQYVPTPLVAAVFLIADMLFLRPPGLWTALVVIGVEFLRSREAAVREAPFPVEWGMVTGVLTAITLANLVTLTVFAVNAPAVGMSLLQLVATVLIYPLVVLLSRFVFGVRKLTPGELDAAGRPR